MENQKTDAVDLAELDKDPQALEKALQADLAAAEGSQADQKSTTIDGTQPGEVDAKKKTQNDRWEKLLADRNEAKRLAETADAEKNALAKTVEELKLEVETLKKASGSSDKTDDTAKNNEVITMDKVMDIVNRKVSEVISVKEQAELAAKSTTDEILATSEIPEFAGIKGRESEVEAIMKKQPSLQASAAYLLLLGRDHLNPAADSNADRLGTGSRSNSDLLRDKTADKMNDKELDAEVRKLFASGGLTF